MACIRQRRGKYVLDYRANGKRRWRTFPLTEEGLKLAEIAKSRLTGETAFAADTTFGEYSKAWLELVKNKVNELTWQKYEIVVRLHLAPLHRLRVQEVTRRRLKAFLSSQIDSGMSKGLVSKILAVSRNMLNEAVDDRILDSNPGAGLGKRLGLSRNQFVREEIRAMEGEQLDAFVSTLRATESPQDALPLLILAYTGLRIGEMIGLTLDDVSETKLRIARQVLPNGRLKLPKGDKARDVDLADVLKKAIDASISWRREHDFRINLRSPWLVYHELGGPVKMGVITERAACDQRVRRTMARVLKAARLEAHFTPHSLRHTFASLLINRGEQLIYVSRQLGHKGIGITADVYAKWLDIPSQRGGPNLLATASEKD